MGHKTSHKIHVAELDQYLAQIWISIRKKGGDYEP